MHVDKLIKGNKCIHVPLHVRRSFAKQLLVSLALSRVCVVNVEMVQQQGKTRFQWDPSDACLNEGVEGLGGGLEGEACCSYMHICKKEIAFGFESEYKMRLKQCIIVCVE